MIKFFRNIRQKLFSEGKWSKYFLYALGEVVLIVFGILLALQINNWNENRNLRTKEKEALLEIVSDFETNISELQRLLTGGNHNVSNTIQSIEFLIDFIESNQIYHDSIDVHFNTANQYIEINLKTSGYESLTSTGIDLILDANLRSKIGEYYSSTIERPKIAYKELRDDYYHYMLDYLRNDFIQSFNKLENSSHIAPRNYDELKGRKDYVESLKVFYEVNTYYKLELNKTLQHSIRLKEELDNYLVGI